MSWLTKYLGLPLPPKALGSATLNPSECVTVTGAAGRVTGVAGGLVEEDVVDMLSFWNDLVRSSVESVGRGVMCSELLTGGQNVTNRTALRISKYYPTRGVVSYRAERHKTIARRLLRNVYSEYLGTEVNLG